MVRLLERIGHQDVGSSLVLDSRRSLAIKLGHFEDASTVSYIDTAELVRNLKGRRIP